MSHSAIAGVYIDKTSIPFNRQDSTRFAQFFEKGKLFVQAGKSDSAIFSYKSALPHAQTATDSVYAYNEIGWEYYFISNEDSAAHYSDLALTWTIPSNPSFREKTVFAHSFRLRRVIKYDAGEYMLANEASLNEMNIIRDDPDFTEGISKVFMNMSIELWVMQDSQPSLDHSYSSLEYANKITSSEENRQARQLRAYMMLGLIFQDLGRPEKSLSHHKLALKIIGENISDNAFDHMATCSNIGDIHLANQQYDEARIYYTTGLESLDLIQNHPNYSFYKSSILQKLGRVAVKRRNFEQADEYFKSSQNALNQAVSKDHPNHGRLFNSMAIGFREQGDIDQAINYFNKAIDVFAKAYGKNHISLSNVYNNLGLAYMVKNENEFAETLFDSAFLCNPAIVFNSKLIYQNSTQAIVTSTNKMMNLNNIHSDSEDRQRELKRIYREIIDQANMSFILGEDISEEVLALFEIIYQKTQTLYSESKSKDLLDILWEISEYDKSRKLLTHLNEQSALKDAIPADYLKRQRAIQENIESHLYQELDNPEDSDSLLVVLNVEYDNLIREIERLFPDYHKLKYNHEISALSQIQESLDKNETILEYYLGDSTLHLTLITSDTVEIKKLENDSAFHANIALFEKALRSPNVVSKSNDFLQSSFALFNYLIAPIKESIQGKQLTIVPSSVIALIPFGALLSESVDPEKVSNFKSLPFLIKDHSISYANSMTLLNNSLNRPIKKNNGKVLSLSPSFGLSETQPDVVDTVRGSLGPLKWTLIEVQQIANTFPSDIFAEDQATEDRFRNLASDYAIIHIASHGIVSDSDPLYSKIALSIDSEDSINDGFLHTYELFNTSLNAEMAVLSACNTGFGEVQPGEGIMSLAQGFFYSGVKSTVMSLWLANDESTSKIMGSFYENLSTGNSKDQALRQAKLEHLESSDNLGSHPFYWAQFIANGNMRPIPKSSPNQYYIYGFLVLALMVLIRYRNTFKKRKPVAS